ncbi:MAG: hydroxymethylglutaryl-CoA synthase [Cardiobacteriaceae bacterium]|nr:hydroxymethylglutaryl-CoA synthase [Cardiobacteriaceae bacterium]
MTISVGIEHINFYTPAYFLDLNQIASRDKIDPEKFTRGIGQRKFSVLPEDEDCVSMAANAALPMLRTEENLRQNIDTVIFATESGIDQSKSAAAYLVNLLDLPANCRALEIKQACYGATAGLQFARSYCQVFPHKKVLLIASDNARYDLHSAAEATQGAAAVAMLISANPKIAKITGESGLFSRDAMDFWRPNCRDTPLVDGKLSTLLYIKAAEAAWRDFQQKNGKNFADFARYCYHLPFTKMGQKAHSRLLSINDLTDEPEKFLSSTIYSRDIGNCYTAALYLSFISTLDHSEENLAGKNIAMLSYGSGCVAEFFALEMLAGYEKYLNPQKNKEMIAARQELTLREYEQFWRREEFKNPENCRNKVSKPALCKFLGIENFKRIYEKY